jgi:hypothetical protein
MTPGNSARSQYADYEASWRSLQRRDRLVWGIAVSYVPCMAVLMVGVMMVGEQVTPQLFVYAAVLWLGVYVVASYYRQDFRCPRCTQRFFPRGGDARSCAFCNLPLWAPASGKDAAESVETTAAAS